MQFQLFKLSVLPSDGELQSLNSFLASHRIVDVDKQFVDKGEDSFWTFCVRYMHGEPTVTTTNKKKAEKIDYREVLDEVTFEKFSRLRNIRKEIAAEKGLALYLVFENKELAAIASLNDISHQAVSQLEGIGKQRLQNFAKPLVDRFLEKNNEKL